MYRDSILSPGPDDRYSGIRALWMKAIIRAMFDWAYRDSPKLEHRVEARKAYVWLFEPSDLFNGFDNVCRNILDIDPEKVRERARNITVEDVAKIEHLERAQDEDRHRTRYGKSKTEDEEDF